MNNGFLCFDGRIDLSIFTGHKDSIKYWVEHFAIVGVKGNFDWGLDLGWGVINTFYNSFSFLFEWEQLYFTRITFLPFRYNVFKCLNIQPVEDCYSADINHSLCCCFLWFLSLCYFVFWLIVIYFSAFIVPMDKISMPQNFSLNRDIIRVAVEGLQNKEDHGHIGGDGKGWTHSDINFASSTLYWG